MRAAALIIVVVVAPALGLETHAVQLALLYLAPALLLWGLLSRDHYPGEEILARVRRAHPRAPIAGRAAATPLPRPAPRLMPRGGVLVAWRLAGRAPPAPAAP